MKEIIIKKINDLISLLRFMEYGSVLVKIEDAATSEALNDIIKLIGFLKGNEFLYTSEGFRNEIVNGDYESVKLEGWLRLTWSERDEKVPEFSYDEIAIRKAAETARDEAKSLQLSDVRPELVKYAAKAAKLFGVKFISSDVGVMFNGQKKGVSAYKQIEEALMRGDSKIELDPADVNIQTVRVYASSLNGFAGGKIKVSGKDGKIIVRLKEPDAKEAAAEEFKTVLEKTKMYLNYTDILSIVNGTDIHRVVERIEGSSEMSLQTLMDKSDNEPIWEQYGYDTEKEYLDYQKQKQKDLDEWEDTPAEKLPEGVKIIDGLPQYTMEVPDKSEPGLIINDDDF